MLVPMVAAVVARAHAARLARRARSAPACPCGPINTLDQVFADPQVVARGMRIDLPHPLAGTVPQVARAAADCRRTPLSPTSGRRRCWASTRRRCCASGSRLRDAAIDGARGARRDRGARAASADVERASTAQARVLDRLRAARGRVALALAWRLFPLAIPLVNLDITIAATRRSPAEARALAEARSSRPPDARTRRALRPRPDDAELRRARRRRQGRVRARWSRASAYAPYWWEVRLFAPGEVDGGDRSGSVPTARERILAAARRDLRAATRRRRRSTPRRRARLARRARAQRLGRRFRAVSRCSSSRSRRAPSGRVDHSFVFERRRRARRGAHPAAARRRRRRADRSRRRSSTCPRAFERRFQEMRSANNTIAGVAQPRRRPALRTRRLHPRRAVAAAPALAAVAAGAGGGTRRRRRCSGASCSPTRRPRGSRFATAQNESHVLDPAGRHRAARDSSAAGSATRWCSWRPRA